MTTIIPQVVSCIICGTKNDIFNLASTNSFGSPDLDYRPAGMARYILIYEVQTCINCGFSASNISDDFKEYLSKNKIEQKEQLKEIKKIIASEKYKILLQKEFFPDFSNSFLAASFIQEKLGNYNAAFHLAMKSAWMADDNGNINAAEYSRNKALKLLDKTTEDFVASTTKLLLKIELLRRIARFEEAGRLINKGLIELQSDEQAIKLISYQNKLVIKKDTSIHTVDEAFG
ncbi:MAG: DUF2225 domain-containing protein [Melioribacteraceae bacterium]|nr:DUF2225 domain-containing protein [Melioribacteraceae bacterium]